VRIRDKVLAWTAGTAVAIVVASAAYQALAERADRKRYPPPGKLVDVGGRHIHFLSLGAGTPPVVFIHALGGNVLDFLDFHSRLAGEMRVVVYDRAGTGWSDPPPLGRWSLGDAAADLHATLAAGGIEPPYVLAGHSIGGVIARRFAAAYPAEVAGMLLIDSSHEQQALRFTIDGWRLPMGAYALRRAFAQMATPHGLHRAASTIKRSKGPVRDMPAEFQVAGRALGLTSRHQRSGVREALALASLHGRPAGLGDLPLTVITAADHNPSWLALQEELAAQSTRSVHLFAGKG
jgi:pimeloyl-ACP methyl ester carboxylesterase